jgi:hypothetical protein
MFPSKYLRASDIPAGREVTVNISHLEVEPVVDGDDPKPVLYFERAKKGLVLNKTNATAIAAVYGDDAELWSGKPVVLYATTVLFAGKVTPCIRVRVPAAPALSPLPAPAAARQPGEDPREPSPASVPGDDMPF